MMALSALTAALAEHIRAKTGTAAYAQRLHTAVYPMYAVSALPGETTLMAGGQQLLRQITVRVACHPSRQREEGAGLDMADALMGALLPGLPLLGRHFAPTDCVFREEDHVLRLEFSLTFCDVAEEDGAHPEAAAFMESLTLRPEHKEET